MGIDLTPTCNSCGKKLDLADMRALGDGKGFICKACFEKNTPRPQFLRQGQASLDTPSQQKSSRSTTENEPQIDRIDLFGTKEYLCEACGYMFRRGAETIIKTCPFCGKKDIHQKVEKPADDLLDDEW